MKDRKTHRAVKNILHNELGVTNEKVDILINEYVDKRINEKMESFFNSNRFEDILKTRIDIEITNKVRNIVGEKLRWMSINVSLKEQKPKKEIINTK